MIELLNKPGLWMLVALGPLVALYILKVKRERRPVGSVRLWKEAHRDLMAKHPFKRLTPEIPLLLQALALVLLALALAKPASRGKRVAGEHIAFIVDVSASMGTHVGTTTRMAKARATLAEAVSSMAPTSEAFIVLAGRSPVVLSGQERDTRRLLALSEHIEAQEVEGDLAGAVAQAFERLRHVEGSKTLVIITDKALAKNEPIAVEGASVRVIDVGDEQTDNVAIIRLDVRGGTDPTTKKEQAQAFAMVRNYGSAAREIFLTATIEGQKDPAASRRLRIQPGEKLPVVLTFVPDALDEGKGLTVALSPNDILSADDVAYGKVPFGPRMPVTLVTDDAYSWVGRALDSDPLIDLQELKTAELAKVNVDPHALVILEGVCPKEFPGIDVLVVHPPEGECAGFTVSKEVSRPELTSWEAADPRLRFISFDGVHVLKANPLLVEGGRVSLLRSKEGTLIADASSPGRQITILGFDVADSDWPLKASFVVFVRNQLELARTHRSQGTASSLRTGESLRVAVPAKVSEIRLTGGPFQDREFKAQDGFVVLPMLSSSGLYEVRWTKPQVSSSVIAVNLLSEKESDVTKREISIFQGSSKAETTEGVTSHEDWSAWIALVGLVFLVADLAWYVRKRRSLAVSS